MLQSPPRSQTECLCWPSIVIRSDFRLRIRTKSCSWLQMVGLQWFLVTLETTIKRSYQRPCKVTSFMMQPYMHLCTCGIYCLHLICRILFFFVIEKSDTSVILDLLTLLVLLNSSITKKKTKSFFSLRKLTVQLHCPSKSDTDALLNFQAPLHRQRHPQKDDTVSGRPLLQDTEDPDPSHGGTRSRVPPQ